MEHDFLPGIRRSELALSRDRLQAAKRINAPQLQYTSLSRSWREKTKKLPLYPGEFNKYLIMGLFMGLQKCGVNRQTYRRALRTLPHLTIHLGS